MKLQEIIDTLRYGVLCNISWDTDYRIPQIIANINLGLLQLYSKFPIIEKTVAIAQFSHISIYTLTREYARTNTESTQPYKYILDHFHEPFMDDILQITSGSDEFGRPVPLNDENNPHSWFIPAFNQLQVPNAKTGETCFLTYRCKPTYIEPTTTDLNQEVYLPLPLLDALINFVAFKVFISMGGENTNTAQLYQQLFDKCCLDATTSNILNDHTTVTNIKAKLGGYI